MNDNEVIFIECYEEDGREVEVYEYKGTKIWYNLYYEFEYSIDGYWYTSLEKAKEVIDKMTK